MMNKRIRDLEEDIEDVGERLIKIIPNKKVQEDLDTDETILADRTQLEETQMIKPKMASTVQKVIVWVSFLFSNYYLDQQASYSARRWTNDEPDYSAKITHT